MDNDKCEKCGMSCSHVEKLQPGDKICPCCADVSEYICQNNCSGPRKDTICAYHNSILFDQLCSEQESFENLERNYKRFLILKDSLAKDLEPVLGSIAQSIAGKCNRMNRQIPENVREFCSTYLGMVI